MPAAPPTLTLRLPDEDATAALAARLAAVIEPPARIYLSGDLGAGKTTFVRALLRSLGFDGRVRSPTFTLLEPYNLSRFDVYHFDLYRFSSGEEWLEAGFDEYLRDAAVCLVEWPERAGSLLPAPDLRITLDFGPDPETGERIARLEAGTDTGRRWLTAAAAAGSPRPP